MNAAWSKAALILVGHGSSRNADSRKPILRLTAELSRRALFAEVHAAFWKEPPAPAAVLAGIAAPRVYVIPNFAGEGQYTRRLIPESLGLTGLRTERDGRVILYGEPVGSHPRIARLLARRILDLARNNGLDPAGTAVLVIGHGSKRPGASETTAAVAAHLAATTPFAEVVPCYIEQAPFVRDWPALTGRHMVIAAPFLVAEGMHASEDLPPLFNLTKGETGPAEIFGRRVWLGKGIGSDPEIVDIILDRVAACDSW